MEFCDDEHAIQRILRSRVCEITCTDIAQTDEFDLRPYPQRQLPPRPLPARLES